MKIYLDDERIGPIGWLTINNIKTCIDLLKTKKVTHLSLDHDLGEIDPGHTGYDILLWLEEQVYYDNEFIIPEIVLHTENGPGRKRMLQAIESIMKLKTNDRS